MADNDGHESSNGNSNGDGNGNNGNNNNNDQSIGRISRDGFLVPTVLPSFGRGVTNKVGIKYAADPNGPPIPLRADGRRKRVHPTREQQALLEQFFDANSKPNSKERAEICLAVNINTKSVQIWFQNRRAKLKKDETNGTNSSSNVCSTDNRIDNNAAPSSTTIVRKAGNRTSCSPPSHDTTTNNSTDPSGFSATSSSSSNAPPFHHPAPLPPLDNSMQSVPTPPISHSIHQGAPPLWTTANGSCRIFASELNIGTWRRVATTPYDLVCEISTYQGVLRWAVVESTFTFKMEIPLASILDVSIHPVSGSPIMSSIALDISTVPIFFRELRDPNHAGPTGLFVNCEDFTENIAASQCLRHVLQGSSAEMEKLFLMLSEYFEVALQQQHHQQQQQYHHNPQQSQQELSQYQKQQQQQQKNSPKFGHGIPGYKMEHQNHHESYVEDNSNVGWFQSTEEQNHFAQPEMPATHT
ncbi:hypothetical protein HK100_008034 [Physocladia obscura]|uniref:Homeobox domain-containing protein n=1 Tax=Physocladia obscura TaxID=109957 RepID=A0AAD5TA69_9FUNG|nr:hypothetical protein HK100_008034 [Physocladia obscura]